MNIKGLSCIFPALDIKKTTEYYVSMLDFKAVLYLECSQPHVCLYKDNIEIILLQANKPVIHNRSLCGYGYDAYFYTNQQEKLEKEFTEKHVKFIQHLHLSDYRNKEFIIEDIDGRWLAFGLKIDSQELINNLSKLHTTEMGYARIRKNLKIDEDVVEYCKNIIKNDKCILLKEGKNWYCTLDNIKITINASSYTIITAHLNK